MRHLISPLDLSIEELDEILSLGQAIMQNPEKYSHVCDGKKLATLFYEPSTRTRLNKRFFKSVWHFPCSRLSSICALAMALFKDCLALAVSVFKVSSA